jgi:galactokinase
MELQREPCDMASAGLVLLVVDTHAAHSLSDGGGYAAVRKQCEQSAELLGVTALRDVELADLDRLLTCTPTASCCGAAPGTWCRRTPGCTRR